MRLRQYYSKYKNYIKRTRKFGRRKDIFLADGVQILGLDFIRIDANTTVGENTLFTINERETPGDKMIIGRNVYIGRDNFFTVGRKITIGDYCIFGNKCAFLGADHIVETPLLPYASTGAGYEKEIYIGTNCWLGHAVSVVGGVTIGHGSVVGANSVVVKDIPPFSLAVGNPAKVIKRFNFERNEWVRGEHAPPSRYDDEQIYLESLRGKAGDMKLAYHSSTVKFGDI